MGAETSGQADEDRAWLVRPAAAAAGHAPAHRPVRVAGQAGYLDPIGVKPGEPLRVHLSAPAAHEIVVARLGRDALLVNTPVLNLPGPGASRAIGRPGYAPDALTSERLGPVRIIFRGSSGTTTRSG